MTKILLASLLFFGLAVAEEAPKLNKKQNIPPLEFIDASDLDTSKPISGRKIRLEVEVEIERSVPLAKVVSEKQVMHRHVHLISATTVASGLRKGQRYLIDGMVVDGPCYGAYTIYVYGFYNHETSTPANKNNASKAEVATPSKASD